LEFGGKLNCWGADLHGETIPPKDYFVQIVNGWSWSCGIKIDQTISCWGKILIFSPEDTAGHSSTFLILYLFTHLLTNSTGLFNQITAADNYACGIMIDGRIKCWGDTGDNMRKKIPYGSDKNFVQISCCESFCCALDNFGVAHCFGDDTVDTPMKIITEKQNDPEEYDFYGEELQDQTLVDEENEPVQFRQLSVGEQVVCGVTLHNNHIKCWGHHRYKRNSLPTDIEGPFRQVTVGVSGICAIYDDVGMEMSDINIDGEAETVVDLSSTLKCWGIAEAHTKNQIQGKKYDQVRIGNTGICAITEDYSVECYGLYREYMPEGLVATA